MKIVCIGDSLTYGYGVYNDQCWVELLSRHLNVEVVNKGVNGDTTTGILSRIHKDIFQIRPSHVIIMAGTNDMLMNYPLKNIEENIELILKEVKENSIIPILALQPPIIADLSKIYWDLYLNYENVNSTLSDYINWAKNIAAEKNIRIINFYDKFIENENRLKLYTDGIHPNVEGHKLMLEAITLSDFI